MSNHLAILPQSSALSIVDARSKIEEFRNAETRRNVLLLEMYQGNAHEACGYASFADFAANELDMDLKAVSLPKAISRAFWENQLGPLRSTEFELITRYFAEIPSEDNLNKAKHLYSEYKEACKNAPYIPVAERAYKNGYRGEERKLLKSLCEKSAYPQAEKVNTDVQQPRNCATAPEGIAPNEPDLPEGLNWLVWIFGTAAQGPHAAFKFE